MIETPNLDRISESSVIFTNAYAAAPNCAPSRACLLTGLYTPRHGVYTVVDERHSSGKPCDRILFAESNAELEPEAVTIAETLSAIRYKTGIVGMWNFGKRKKGTGCADRAGIRHFH